MSNQIKCVRVHGELARAKVFGVNLEENSMLPGDRQLCHQFSVRMCKYSPPTVSASTYSLWQLK